MSTFRIDRAHVRYNASDVAWRVEGAGSVLCNVLALRGWAREDCSVTNCYIERDESLPENTMIISPLPPSNEPPPLLLQRRCCPGGPYGGHALSCPTLTGGGDSGST